MAARDGRGRSVAVDFPDLESKGSGSERGLSHDWVALRAFGVTAETV